MRYTAILGLLLVQLSVFAQQKISALFIGNSYTYYNNLPQLLADIALSKGDTLTFDSNTPGGYTFQQHSVDATTLSKINAQAWDVVILQEQSQRPSFPPSQVATDVYPYADSLVAKIRQNNACTKPVFYMTWGRKNGDASNCANYAPLCTYAGMQQRLHDSYLEMGQQHQAPVAPVGAVWRSVRDSFPAIELYNADESHPSLHGSYLAACTFYASMYHKTPVGASYPNGISATDAANIQSITERIVFDSLGLWGIDTSTVQANFTFTVDSGLVDFTNTSANATDYVWDFGDGNTSTQLSPNYQYSDSGSYTVSLIASYDCKTADTISQTILIQFPQDTTDTIGTNVLGFSEQAIVVFPNPSSKFVTISTGTTGGKINLMTLDGRFIQTLPETINPIMDVSSLSNGMYLISLQKADGSRAWARLMVQH